MIKICVNCGVEFVSNSGKQVCCSKKCNVEKWNNLVDSILLKKYNNCMLIRNSFDYDLLMNLCKNLKNRL
jgi:hypothetical protein